MLNDDVKTGIGEVLNGTITGISGESGGSINNAYRIRLGDGRSFFLKTNSGALYAMFRTETDGLRILKEAGTCIRIPEVISHGITPDESRSWLLLEYIERESPRPPFFSIFGRELAKLHRNTQSHFGLDHSNYIGSLEQSNHPHDTWPDFFMKERLLPQMRMAVESGLLPPAISQNFETLGRRLGDIFPYEPPALLHGDLWSGNYLCDSANTPVIIDPAVYYGHREMEIAFTRLFGGYDSDFYASYNEVWPLEKGYEERTDICNLYPLLVHTNLFGSSYAGQVISIIRRFS